MLIDIQSLQETDLFAQRVAQHIDPPMCIALNGTLGSGKTQFSRSLATALGIEGQLVTSPTYVLHQLYHSSTFTIHHFDFYRLESIAQVWDLGIEELYEQHVLVIIEWASKFPDALPDDMLTLDFSQPIPQQESRSSDTTREVRVGFCGPKSSALYDAISNHPN